MLLRNKGSRRGAEAGDERGDVFRQGLDEFAAEPESFGAFVGTPEEQAELDDRSNLVEAIFERGNDPEVAASTSDRPEEVGILVRRCPQDPAVGGHDLARDQVVGAEACLLCQPANPAAQGETTDACVAAATTRDGGA